MDFTTILPASISEDVVSAFAISLGYSPTITTPATEATLAYPNGVETQVPAVPASTAPNPQSPDDFVSAHFADQMIQTYKSAQIEQAVQAAQAQAQQIIDDATATATQAVETNIANAMQSDMAQKAQTHE